MSDERISPGRSSSLTATKRCATRWSVRSCRRRIAAKVDALMGAEWRHVGLEGGEPPIGYCRRLHHRRVDRRDTRDAVPRDPLPACYVGGISIRRVARVRRPSGLGGQPCRGSRLAYRRTGEVAVFVTRGGGSFGAGHHACGLAGYSGRLGNPRSSCDPPLRSELRLSLVDAQRRFAREGYTIRSDMT